MMRETSRVDLTDATFGNPAATNRWPKEAPAVRRLNLMPDHHAAGQSRVIDESTMRRSVFVLSSQTYRPGQQPLVLRFSRSLSRFETQDIKTQPQINHYVPAKRRAARQWLMGHGAVGRY